MVFEEGSVAFDILCADISITDDMEVEGDESFVVVVTSSFANVMNDIAVITILDDDVGEFPSSARIWSTCTQL